MTSLRRFKLNDDSTSKNEILPDRLRTKIGPSIPAGTATPAPRPKKTKKAQAERGLQGEASGKPGYLSQPEATNLPIAHDAKVNIALEQEMEKWRE